MPDALRWIFPETAQVLPAGGVRPLTARVLASRGIHTQAEQIAFLNPAMDQLHDPLLLAGMAEAAARLETAVRARQRILIYGDYDVDGTSSIVILSKAIEIAGGVSEFHVPHRLLDGYGIKTEVIGAAADAGVQLVITVDTGIRALEAVRVANARGVDVIITDHHLPETELPPALAVINPNQPGCPYPEKNLCGAAVAFKLAHALFLRLGWDKARLQRTLASFLKMAAISTVADVVPLLGENRVIVTHGLAGLDRVRNAGLRALLEVAGFAPGVRPDARQVAFRVAPRINAAGRMAHAAAVVQMFLNDDEAAARATAEQLNLLNQERQQTEAAILEHALAECERVPVTDADAALVFCNAGWHRGVVGIVASRLVERFCRPAFVLGEEDGLAQGSGRSVPGFHLLAALESMADLFVRFGGHKQAAGVTLRAERVPEFRRRFAEFAARQLGPADFVPRLSIDAVADLTELDDDGAKQLLTLEPFGCANPEPVIALLDAEMAGASRVFKEKHLRLSVRHCGRLLSITAWNLAPRAAEFPAGMRVDAAFKIEHDSYSESRGYSPWCAVLRDVRPAAAIAGSAAV